MSSGYNINGIDLLNFLQPYFTGSDLTQLSGFKINGVQAFARRDNNPNNAPTIFNTGFKYNGVDIAQYGNKANASLTIQITGNKIYNGQGQQANIVLISPTDSWINVQTTNVTDVGLYDSNYFSYTPPNGYNLSVNFSYFSIDPSEINLIPNGGPTSFTWTGSSITFTSYSVTGVFPQDTGWSVNDTIRSAVGSYYAYLSTLSQNYVLGTLQSINWTIVPSSVPGPPPIDGSTAGDKSFTANWSAPSVTGGEITGYYVSYSTNNGTSWSSEVSTTSLTYTWSGNGVIYNGNTYIARVRAYNSLGNGSYSQNSGGAVPTFAAPTFTITAVAPSTSSPGYRAFNVTYTPTACVNYASTYIFLLSPYDSFGVSTDINTYTTSANGGYYNTGTTTTTPNQPLGPIFSVYANNIFSSGFYTVGTNETYWAIAATYNNDNYYVASAPISVYMQPRLYSPPVYTITGYSTATGTFTVTGNTFTQISTYAIPNADTNVTGLTINASTNGTVTICTTSRYFIAYFANQSTTNFNQSLSCLRSPWSTNSGTTVRSLAWPGLVGSGYNQSGNGKIRINGAGSIGTWLSNQRIIVTVSISGEQRTNTGY